MIRLSRRGEVTSTETVIVENGDPGCAIGRRPEGLIPSQSSGQTRNVGTFFATATRLEAASVFAFARFEKELRRIACRLSMEDAPLTAAGLPGRNESLRMLAGVSEAVALARG